MRPPMVLALVAGACLPACSLNQQGVPPFRDAIAFPASALVDPGGHWLYVANANSDLRYNDGTLVAVSLDQAMADVQGGDWADCPEVGYIHLHSNPNPNFCCRDLLDRTILNCDERRYIPPTTTVRIGSFGSGMVYQPRCDVGGVAAQDPAARCPQACTPGDEGRGRLFIGVRGNSSVTWADVDVSDPRAVPVLTCADPMSSSFAQCDPNHRLTVTAEGIGSATLGTTSQPVLLPDEPYALVLDDVRQLLYVGALKGDVAHPGTGGVSLVDVLNPTFDPALVNVHGTIFPSDPNGFFGITSLTRRDFGGNRGEVFATSRYLPRVGGVVPANIPNIPCTGPVVRSEIALIPTGDAFDTTLPGTETRGIVFLPDAPRIFVLQRVPPALIGFNVGTDSLGGRVITPTDVVETCAQPTFLQTHNPAGAGSRLFITCFETGQVYVVDPYVPRIVNVIEVGRGPAGLAFGPGPGQDPATTPADQGTRGYVVGFGDNNISVVDLAPPAGDRVQESTQYHVVQRIGFPSTVPR